MSTTAPQSKAQTALDAVYEAIPDQVRANGISDLSGVAELVYALVAAVGAGQ